MLTTESPGHVDLIPSLMSYLMSDGAIISSLSLRLPKATDLLLFVGVCTMGVEWTVTRNRWCEEAKWPVTVFNAEDPWVVISCWKEQLYALDT